MVACQGPRCLIMVSRVGAEMVSYTRLFDGAGPVGTLVPVPGPVAQEGGGAIHWDGARYWLLYTLPVPANPNRFRGHVPGSRPTESCSIRAASRSPPRTPTLFSAASVATGPS